MKSNLDECRRMAVQRAHRTAEAPQIVIDAVQNARMDSEHDVLNELMDRSRLSHSQE